MNGLPQIAQKKERRTMAALFAVYDLENQATCCSA
jgi:hypothetical protein